MSFLRLRAAQNLLAKRAAYTAMRRAIHGGISWSTTIRKGAMKLLSDQCCKRFKCHRD
jgi:hypothetical protein